MSSKVENTDIKRWKPNQPLNELKDLPPDINLETHGVLKACIGARAALSQLKEACRLIPNPAILINAIPLLEAQASSEIENIVTTSDTLFRYAQLEERMADPATKEALRYRTALRDGFESLKKRPLNLRTAVQVCSTIKGVDMEVRRVPGIALKNSATGDTLYTPPESGALLRDKLANWERFIHEEGTLDPLIRMAAAHYQFEAIHPFIDGNGRTGRVLNLLLLVEWGLLEIPVLYLSRYILKHRAEYYRRLQSVTTHDEWEAWTLYLLAAVQETSEWTTQKIYAIRKLQQLAKQHVRTLLPKIYSHELIDVIFAQPYSRIQNLVAAGIAKRQAASTYLQSLKRIGVLDEVRVGREKMFLHPKLLQLLTRDANKVTAYPAAGANDAAAPA